MRVLLKRVLILSLCSCSTLIFLAIGPGVYESDLAVLVRKKELLIDAYSPKLVIIGGSGMLYGVDSKWIEEELRVKVVNLSIYAGCGSEFYSKFVPQYLNEGDVVLFMPEYVQYMHNLKLSDPICRKWAFISVFPSSVGFLYQNYKQQLIDLIELATSKIRGEVSSLLNFRSHSKESGVLGYRLNYSGNGDKLTGFWNAPSLEGRISLSFSADAINSIQTTIADFNRKVTARKAKFFVISPAAAQSWFLQQHNAIENLFSKLRDFGVIGKPDEFVYKDALFQDTVNHLGEAGRHLRTRRLISLLKEHGIFFVRKGADFSVSGTISPKTYDFISGFYADRTFTKGDAYFHELQYNLNGRIKYLVVTTMGWSPKGGDVHSLGLRVRADNHELTFIKKIGFSYWFRIPAELPTVDEIELLSNTVRPIDLGINDDGRLLGVDVKEITFKEKEE